MDDQQRASRPLNLPWEPPAPKKVWLPPKPVPAGSWEPWTFDMMKGWTLKVHPVFEAQVRQRRGDVACFEFSLNGQFIIGQRDTLDAAQRACEGHIVNLVRQMLPAYRAVHQRATGAPAPTSCEARA